MLFNLLRKFQDSLTHHQHALEGYEDSFTCARCGSKIVSLTESPHFQDDGDLLFFCTERCYARYMQYRLNKQARWAVRMLKKMQHQDAKLIAANTWAPKVARKEEKPPTAP